MEEERNMLLASPCPASTLKANSSTLAAGARPAGPMQADKLHICTPALRRRAPMRCWLSPAVKMCARPSVGSMDHVHGAASPRPRAASERARPRANCPRAFLPFVFRNFSPTLREGTTTRAQREHGAGPHVAAKGSETFSPLWPVTQ